MLDSSNYVAMIIYLILSGISVLINGIIVLMILQRVTKIQTPYLLLIFYFHISIVGDVITALPYMFDSSTEWCKFNEPMKYYFSLMNILIIMLLVQGNRITLTLASDMAVVFEKRVFAYFLIFLLPCISFIPYATDYYQHDNPNNPFCTVTDRAGSYWPIVVQYFWVWLVNFFNLFTNGYLSYVLLCGDHYPQLRRRFFFGIGGYSLIAIVAWISRAAAQFSLPIPSDDDSTGENEVVRYELFRFYPMVIASLFYASLFFVNRKTILMLERSKSTASSNTLSIGVKDLLDIVESGDGKSLYGSFKLFLRGSSFSARASSEMENKLRYSQEVDRFSKSSTSARNSNQMKDDKESIPSQRTISANSNGIAMKDMIMYDNPLKTSGTKKSSSRSTTDTR